MRLFHLPLFTVWRLTARANLLQRAAALAEQRGLARALRNLRKLTALLPA